MTNQSIVARLRERAEFEDRRVLDEATAMGFVPEVYNGSQTGALLREAAAALEAAREDAERYRFIRTHCDLLEMMDNTIVGWQFYNNGCAALDQRVDTWAEQQAAIDQGRGKAGQEVGDG